MNYGTGKFLAVVFAVLVILATGPTVAFASAQAFPPVEPLESNDIRKTHSEVTPTLPPTSSAHFATTPFRPEAALDDRSADPVWPNPYGFLRHGERKGHDRDGAENGKQETGEGNDGAAGQNETNDNRGEGKGTGEGKGKQKGTKGARGHDENGRDAGRDEGRGHDGGNSKNGCKDTASSTGPPNESVREPSQCGRSGPLTVESGDIQLGPNATALEHRQAAWTLIAEANASGPGKSEKAFERTRQRALDELNTTYAHVLDEDRVTSAAVFETDHRAITPLHNQLPNATRHLVTSDRLLAEQAIVDVETVRAALDERNVSYDEAAVQENLSEARAAYQQGQQLPVQARHARSQHYREAWTHAQRAIDVMDEAVEPNVSIHSRRDVPHNGSYAKSVNATIFDVRPYELAGELVVTEADANGTTTTNRTVAITASTEPVTVATVNTTEALARQRPGDNRTYILNLSATDPGVDLADQGYDAGDQLDLHSRQRRGAPLG